MRRKTRRGFSIGMDCGGTRTRAVLGDVEGRVLSRAMAGPGNPLSAGRALAFRSYELAIRRLLRKARLRPDQIGAVCLGAAGAGRPAERREISAILRKLLPYARISVDTDAVIALFGATLGRPGIIVIAGTGSIVLGMGKDGEIARAGGWGMLLGDEGSGAVLGREAIKAVLRAADGRAGMTRLREPVLRHFRVRAPEELVTRIYRKPPIAKEYAQLWPALLAASGEGDRAAREILRKGGEDLAETVLAVATRVRLEKEIPLILSGGILARDSPLRRSLLRQLKLKLPRGHVTVAAAPPVLGALLRAASLGAERITQHKTEADRRSTARRDKR